MSSPPLNESCNRVGLFKWPVRLSANSRWPQALVQNRKQLRLRSFVLAAWPSCRGPRQPAANELGGGPVRHVLSPSSNAWPARPRQARPRHIPRPTSLRALHRVPSSVALRAHLPGPHSVEASGSAFPIKTGSEFPIGPTWRLRPWRVWSLQFLGGIFRHPAVLPDDHRRPGLHCNQWISVGWYSPVWLGNASLWS